MASSAFTSTLEPTRTQASCSPKPTATTFPTGKPPGADSLDSRCTALTECSRLYRPLVRIEHHLDGEYACDARA
jgi:hypothetical protein